MIKNEQGFILAATLWMLAFMAMGVAYFSQDILSAVEKASKQQQGIKTEIAMLNTQATLLYLMMIEPVSEAGIKRNEETSVIPENSFNIPLKHLPLDGRTIKGFENIIFSIQDEAGLVPLNFDNSQVLETLLRLLSVPSEAIAGMIAKLRDYRDNDSLYRISGAEDRHYKKLKLPSPLNADLYISGQAHNIAGWSKQKSLWDNNKLLKNTNTVWNSFPNFNTAPKLVLQSMGGISATDADTIIKQREFQPLKNMNVIFNILGKRLMVGSMVASFFPSKYFRITLWAKNKRQKRVFHVELTPFLADYKPWRVNAQYHIIDTPSTPAL